MDKLVKTYILIEGLFVCLFLTCCQRNELSTQAENIRSSSLEVKYARGFQLDQKEGNQRITVSRPWQGANPIAYTLVLRDQMEFSDDEEAIKIPVKNLVITSTSHIPFLDLLGVTDLLVGFPQTSYISSARMRARIDQNLVRELGTPNGLDLEALIELHPELVVTYHSEADRSTLDNLGNTGIPTVLMADHLEETPLGRAEWIKFVGLLTGRYRQADSIFKEIENAYFKYKAIAKKAPLKPTVYSGIVYGDTWFAPGGNSFVAQFIADAGGIYTWQDQQVTGSLQLSFEAVFDRNIATDFWIGAGGYTSRAEMSAADSRYTAFKAFERQAIYNYHRRIGDTGGFEYLELGGARPDIVLADFIKILHPELLPDHQFYFFQQLD